MDEDEVIRLFEALMDCLAGPVEGPAQSLAEGIIELLTLEPTTTPDCLRCRAEPGALAQLPAQWEAQPAGGWPA